MSKRIKVQGLQRWVEVRHHSKAQRLTLRINPTQRIVTVTMPMGCDHEQAVKFLSNHVDWIRDRLTKIPTAVPFVNGSTLNLRGEHHSIVFTNSKAEGPKVVAQVLNRGARELHVGNDAVSAPNILRTWLISQARQDLTDRVEFYTLSLGLNANKISVCDPTSRWGSCSCKGNLSFSWRLVMAPPQILDYVVAHEVAHLAEMNHGPRFWNLVSKICPHMDRAKHWLQVHGIDLHRYGAEN